MGFGEAVKTVYSKYATFHGRASRPEYWWFYLFFTVVYLALYLPAWFALMGNVLEAAADSKADSTTLHMAPMPGWAIAMMFLAVLFALGTFLPMLSVLVRRLHDTDRSGWWYWIALVPFIGGIILFVFLVLPGTPGRNQYGDPV